MSTYTFYGCTNIRSVNPENCLVFFEDYTDDKSLHSYSTSYYKGNHFLNDIPMKPTDFQYIVEIVVDTSRTYIVRNSKDIIKNFQDKQGQVNYDILTKHLKKPINGFILYDINVPHKTTYIPYILLNKKCVISSKLIKKRTPLNRVWVSVEDCDSYNHFQCVDSETCTLKFDKKTNHKQHITQPLGLSAILKMASSNKVVGCMSSKTVVGLPLSKLHRVLIPYKYYTLTEFETEPYNVYQYNHERPKPLGLWFAGGDEWVKYVVDNDFNTTKYKYLYEVVVKKDKMIYISDLKDLYEFSEKYGVRSAKYVSGIAWDKVITNTKKYGIIIHPNLKTMLFDFKVSNVIDFDYYHYFKDMEWYLTWDVSSGVVWNKKGFKSFKLIYKLDEGKLVDYK